MKIINLTRNITLAENADLADSFGARLKGLLGKKELAAGQALLITSCNSIHTLFMGFAIDVIFADSRNQIVGLLHNFLPWRISPIFFKASYVIELPAGTLQRSKSSVGDALSLR